MIRQILPQGWGFFSKDPRSEMDNVIEMQSGKQAVTWPNNSVKNIFGIYRYGRSQGIELGLIQSKIPKSSEWNECTNDSFDCLSKIKSNVKIENDTPNASLCGDLGLIKSKPVPWAWSHYQNNNKKTKVMRVDVTCSKSQ